MVLIVVVVDVVVVVVVVDGRVQNDTGRQNLNFNDKFHQIKEGGELLFRDNFSPNPI